VSTTRTRVTDFANKVEAQAHIVRTHLRVNQTGRANLVLGRITDICRDAYRAGLLPAVHAELRRRGYSRERQQS
jgi:hypothetical protein